MQTEKVLYLHCREIVICNAKHKNKLISNELDIVSKCKHENKYILKNSDEQ